MAENNTPNPPLHYQIRLQGYLNRDWNEWLGGVVIEREEETTLLTCAVVDQATLYGLLRQIRDLGIPLISVHRIES
ncbi:MAG: hypothetical protein AAF125_01825 [Chloroflexota bacterium]